MGAELGGGAEIAYIFGFTNALKTEELICGSAVIDVDVVLVLTLGAAVGLQFNEVFYYEFTFGGGITAGLGGALCTGLQYGNATIVNGTRLTL